MSAVTQATSRSRSEVKDSLVTVVGRLVGDSSQRTSDGFSCRLRIAVIGRRWSPRRERWTRKIRYFNVVVHGEAVEDAMRNFAKGRRLLVEGRLDRYEREFSEGDLRLVEDIVASRLSFFPWGKAEQDAEEHRLRWFPSRAARGASAP
jgi:single-stranded DNA-binding protein